jgi:hypothetical protein
MREPCPQSVYGGCDPATCDRQCSATINIPPPIEAGYDRLVCTLVAAIIIISACGVAGAVVAAERVNRAYSLERV